MVRVAGLEPALLSEQDFESSASTNSTTPAQVWEAAQSSGGIRRVNRRNVAKRRCSVELEAGREANHAHAVPLVVGHGEQTRSSRGEAGGADPLARGTFRFDPA